MVVSERKHVGAVALYRPLRTSLDTVYFLVGLFDV
jgi:hypothetical protein